MQGGRWCYDEVMCIVIEGPELTLVNFENTLDIFNSLGTEGIYICPQLLPATAEGICINEDICLLDIAISSAFPALKTTVLTTLRTNSSYEH